MEPSLFGAFYGLEPMSAGLLPTLAYADRRAVVEGLAAEWRRKGVVVTQTWILASAVRKS